MIAQYGVNEDGTDESKPSLHPAVEEGNVDFVKSLLERSRYQLTHCIQPDSVRWSSGEGESRCHRLAHRLGRGGVFT